MTPFFRSISLLIIKYSQLSSGDIQQRRCTCVDTHKFPLCLPVCLAHRHQKVHGFPNLLKIRGSERILMQMLQNVPVSILQRCGHGRLKEIS